MLTLRFRASGVIQPLGSDPPSFVQQSGFLDVNRYKVQRAAISCRQDVYGFQIHQARFQRSDTGTHDAQFLGEYVV